MLLQDEGRRVAWADAPEQALAMMHDESLEGLFVDGTAAEFSAAVLDERTRVGRMLDGFTYSVSHDLRAPLRSVDGFSAVLVEHAGDTLDDKARDYLGRIRAGAVRMADMIDGLLELSRLARAPLTPEPADLSALAARVAASLDAAEPERSVAVSIEPGLVADADRSMVTRLFEQLLGNSRKFTARVERAAVEVGAVRTAEATTYFVRDNGDGFDTAYADKLFQPFQRCHRASDYPGRGLGLAIVAGIVARHRGTVRAESAPGVGTTIHFTLPSSRRGLQT